MFRLVLTEFLPVFWLAVLQTYQTTHRQLRQVQDGFALGDRKEYSTRGTLLT